MFRNKMWRSYKILYHGMINLIDQFLLVFQWKWEILYVQIILFRETKCTCCSFMEMGFENQPFRRVGFYVRFYFSFVAGNAICKWNLEFKPVLYDLLCKKRLKTARNFFYERLDLWNRRWKKGGEIGRFNVLIRETLYRSRRSNEQDELLPICI